MGTNTKIDSNHESNSKKMFCDSYHELPLKSESRFESWITTEK